MFTKCIKEQFCQFLIEQIVLQHVFGVGTFW